MLEFESLLSSVKKQRPLVLCITNYVTVNDCANILLAFNASPIMSAEAKEMFDLVNHANSLYINIGTLNTAMLKATFKALKHANQNHIPIVLDPVGIGASKLREKVALRIIKKYHPTIIKGNAAEIKFLINQKTTSQGVDAIGDITDEKAIKLLSLSCQQLAARTNAVICLTGAIDIIANASQAYAVYNGDQRMKQITGTGCMLGALLAASVAVDTDYLNSCLYTVALFGYAGQLSIKHQPNAGNSTWRNNLIDSICMLDIKTFSKELKYVKLS